MTYTIKQGRIRVGHSTVPVFSVMCHNGLAYAHEDTRAKAEAHIPLLEAADKRNAEAAKASSKNV